MKITVIAVGKLRVGPETMLVDHFAKRITWPFQILEVEEKKKRSVAKLKKSEANLLLKRCPSGSEIIALDQRGENISSMELATKFNNWQNTGSKEVCILIGRANGLDDIVRQRASFVISFGRLTWPHMLSRVMLTEQIYRAKQIIDGHPYHRE